MCKLLLAGRALPNYRRSGDAITAILLPLGSQTPITDTIFLKSDATKQMEIIGDISEIHHAATDLHKGGNTIRSDGGI